MRKNVGKVGFSYGDLPYKNHAALTPPCTFLLMVFPLQSTKSPGAIVLRIPPDDCLAACL
jgi:hypothetical protein